MSKSKSKKRKMSGSKKAVLILSVIMLSLIMAFSILFGVSMLKKSGPVVVSPDATTYRKQVPTDGTLPTDATPIDNIGYMAYVFDNQSQYHVYAHNSTKSVGYEQITQSWKDFKSAEKSGEGYKIMVASDLSYSGLVKSATQSCFMGDDKAILRNGSKPTGTDSTPFDIQWDTGMPSIYDKEGFKYDYGEFATEISVYVINEDTLTGADDVIVNDDGTYTQTYYLNEKAGCWYQYGMKTRGGLTDYPKFESIVITFTFDSKWQIIESYCEEKASICPRALGGLMDMASNSVTTTKIYYEDSNIDEEHFAHYDNFFKQYRDADVTDNTHTPEEPDAITVLGSGFSNVLSDDGQQFKMAITLGETKYNGRVFLKIPDMGNVLESLDARVSLEREDAGTQDLYVEFKESNLNLYFNTGFAMTADIDDISQSVTKITDWVNGLKSKPEVASYALTAEEVGSSSGLDLDALLQAFDMQLTDTEALITLQSDDLLGLGIGVDAVLGFDRTNVNGIDLFSIKSVDLKNVKYNGTTIDVKAEIVPDDSDKIIEREQAETPADIADYIDSVFNILNSKTVKVNIGLDDNFIEGLTLDAVAYLALGSDIAAYVEISALYKGVSLKLNANYIYEGTYGKIYLHVTEINGEEVDAKVYCDIDDAVTTIKDIIAIFSGNSNVNTLKSSAEDELAAIINKVLKLNFATLLGKITGDNNRLTLNINVDELLKVFDVSLDMQFGTVELTVDRVHEQISGSAPSLGLNVNIEGSENGIPAIDKKGYVDVNVYLDGVYSLLRNPSYDITLSFAGAKLTDEIDLSDLKVDARATLAIENGKTIRVQLPLTVQYGEYGVELTAYYTVNVSDKTYGEIYLHITSVTVSGEKTELNAKVYCDIKEVVDGVQSIIDMFSPKDKEEGNEEIAAVSENTDIVLKVVETLLKLNYNEIIEATNEQLTVTLDVDAILSELELDLGGITFGELKLEFIPQEGTLKGELEALGLEVSVSGNEKALAEIESAGYVDLGTYLDSITALLNKNSYYFELSFLGNNYISDEIDLTGLIVSVNAQLAFADSFGGIEVNISDLVIVYKEVSLELSAHYEVAFDGSYGTVYLDISKVNDTEVSAKVQLDITDAVNGIKGIINLFKTTEVKTYSSVQKDTLAKILNGVLKLNFNEILRVTNKNAELNLDLDLLLSEFDLGLNLGVVNLTYVPEDFALTGSDNAIGLNLIKISGSDNKLGPFSANGYIDLNEFIGGVEEIVYSDVYEISLNFTGSEITDKIDLSGLTVSATAYATLKNGYNNITVSLPMLISYYGLEVELTAYYSADINLKNYSTVYLEITRIDSTMLHAKVYCDIEDAIAVVKEIMGALGGAPEAAVLSDDGTSDIISKVVGLLLKLDYANIIKGSQDNLSLTLNVDDILSELDMDLGITFGELQLDFTLDKEVGATLYGKLEALGVQLSLKGNNSYTITAPTASEYLDVVQVLRLVKDMIDEGLAIKEAKDIVFSLDVVIAEMNAEIHGSGEALWGDSTKVAISLTVTVDGETLEINFVYDDTAKGSAPLVIITVNEIGTTISRDEIDLLVDSFKGLVDSFTGSGSSDNSDETLVPPDSTGYALGVGGKTLEDILKNENVKKLLNAILGFAGEFTVELQRTDADEAIYNLLVKHSGGLNVTLGADGCLSLAFAKAGKFSATASVEAGNGTTVSALQSVLLENTDEKYTYYELSQFVKQLYNGFFDKFESISLKEILGDNPYRVNINLSGANSGIEVLEGITIDAEMYYDEGVVGTQRETKLMYTNLNLNINGTLVKASAAYKGRTIYLELTDVGATTLSGIKFKTDVSNLFEAAEQLVRLVTDTNLVETINRFKGNFTPAEDDFEVTESISLFAAAVDETGTPATSTLTKLIEALLSLNLEESFKFDRDTHTAEINIDSLSEALLGIKIGTVNVTVDTEQKTLDASVKLEDRDPWISLKATALEEFARKEINPDDYMDIGFISTLLYDLVNTVADDNKQLYSMYTFVGSIAIDITDIPVLGSIDIRLNNAAITVGVDSNDKFYFTLAASLQKKTVIGMKLTDNADISITYSEGYIVLGRNIGTSSEVYKVMTIEYLLDNLMDKNNSPLQWLLGTSSVVWGILVDNVPVNLDSGLTKPKTYMLYEQLAQNEKEVKVDLADYISGMTVKAGSSEPLSVYGDGAPVATSKFNLANNNNHYAFDLNAKGLTGGTLTALCAVLFRNDDGISGIKAYTNIASMVDVTLDFGTYVEGVTEVYGGKVLNFEKASVDGNSFYSDYKEVYNLTAESFVEKDYYVYDSESDSYIPATEFIKGTTYFEKVNGRYYLEDGTLATEFDASKQYYEYVERDSDKKLGDRVAVRNYLAYVTETYHFDRNHEFTNNAAHINSIFGCFSTEKNGTYYSSDVLETIYLDVYAGIGAEKPERILKVLYSSTVLLVSDFPEFADTNRNSKLIYVNAEGENLGQSMIIDDSVIVYVDGVGRVSVYKSSEKALQVEFVFVKINGMQSVTAAFADGDKLKEYVLNDYSFLGWYREESFVNKVDTVYADDAVNGKITLYGKYVKSLIEAENGVNYSFDSTLDGYYVSGTNKNVSFYYNNQSAWLEIASEINGYPVYYIAENAFAMSSDSANSLVNVLVPESIIAVYSNAFSYNRSLKNVVFCADNVFFGGVIKEQTTVFYGSHPGSSLSSTYNGLYVYYNGTASNPYSHVSTASSMDSDWAGIYFKKSITGLFDTIHTMKLVTSGWAYAKYIVNINSGEYTYLDEIKVFSDGLASVIYTANQIENAMLAEINNHTATNDLFINGFEVDVSSGTKYGKCTIVNIDVTAASTRAYELDYDVNCNAYISGVVEFNGKMYATANEQHFIIPKDGYEIVSVDGVECREEDGAHSFVMPEQPTKITIECRKMKFTQVTLISDIAFTFEGVNYDSSVTVSGEEGWAMVGGATAQNGEYTFIGWAYKASDTAYVFEGATINYNVYYAIWAYQRAEITSWSVDASNQKITAKVDSTAHSVYGLYSNKNFSGGLIAQLNSNSASFTTLGYTILYPRMQYTFTYNMSASTTTKFYYVNSDNSESSANKSSGTYSGSFSILEGTELNYSWVSSNTNFKIEYYDNDTDTTPKVLYFRIKNLLGALKLTLTGAFTNADLDGSQIVNGDLNLNIAGKQ